MLYTEKDIKFLRSAKSYADEFVTCISKRKIGSVIVKNGRAVSQGVNGPPNGVEHLENRFIRLDNKAVAGYDWFYSPSIGDWIKPIIIDRLYGEFINSSYKTITMKFIDVPDGVRINNSIIYDISVEYNNCEDRHKQRIIQFADSDDKKGEVIEIVQEVMCPRYLFGFKSGEMLSICGCVHSEANSIICCALNGIDINNCTLYCYCGIPCISCTGLIINAGIKRVVCLQEDNIPDYDIQSRIYFKEANVEITQIPIELCS